jgi:hypothetical protein
VSAADIEMPACTIYVLFISAESAEEKEKNKKHCCLLVFGCLQPIQYLVLS